MAILFIPQGYLASDNDAAAKIRASLAKDLKEGKPVEIASSGDVMGQNGEQKKLVTQPGKLASEDDAAAKIRASLAKDLKEGKPVEIASSGDVMGQNGEQKKLVTQPGKLASYQWYDREPQRLRDEIEGMNHFFLNLNYTKWMMDDIIGKGLYAQMFYLMVGHGKLLQFITMTILLL